MEICCFDAYLCWFECAAAQTLSLLRLALLHNHGVVASACRNDHGSIGVTSVHSFVEHNVLWIVLSKASSNMKSKHQTRQWIQLDCHHSNFGQEGWPRKMKHFHFWQFRSKATVIKNRTTANSNCHDSHLEFSGSVQTQCSSLLSTCNFLKLTLHWFHKDP